MSEQLLTSMVSRSRPQALKALAGRCDARDAQARRQGAGLVVLLAIPLVFLLGRPGTAKPSP